MAQSESDIITRYEIMDGAPIKIKIMIFYLRKEFNLPNLIFKTFR